MMCGSVLSAQPRIIDQVVAVVGNNHILQSDVENMYMQYKAEGIEPGRPDFKCGILEELLTQNLLLNQARIDSIEVSESSVEMQLNARLQFFIDQIGSQERLEEYFNKSVLEIKRDFRDIIRDQLITQQMSGNITGDVEITPSEVKDFSRQTPEDSLPYINLKIQVSQIMMYPPLSEEGKFEVREKLLALRKRILEGEKFSTLAVLYSEGPSAPRGGEIGYMAKSELDPEYAEVAFSLKEGAVSRIVESSFGFHIIQLIEKRGNRVNTRHILMKPDIDEQALQKTVYRLDSIAREIRNERMDFVHAARLFSEDEKTRINGGKVINLKDNTYQFAMDELIPEDYAVLRDMKVGEISDPFASRDDKGKTVYKIVRLDNRTPPHRANLREDYMVLQRMALSMKKNRIFNEWIREKAYSTYIHIDDTFGNCKFKESYWLR